MTGLPLERKRVFGKDRIYSLCTYFEYVRKGNNCFDVKVAGPYDYDNEMNIDLNEEPNLLKAFKNIRRVEDLCGHSCTAFYQESRLIGFI